MGPGALLDIPGTISLKDRSGKFMFNPTVPIILAVAFICFGLGLYFDPRWYPILRDTFLTDNNYFWGTISILIGVLVASIAILLAKR
jgi:hypothetical protein